MCGRDLPTTCMFVFFEIGTWLLPLRAICLRVSRKTSPLVYDALCLSSVARPSPVCVGLLAVVTWPFAYCSGLFLRARSANVTRRCLCFPVCAQCVVSARFKQTIPRCDESLRTIDDLVTRLRSCIASLTYRDAEDFRVGEITVLKCVSCVMGNRTLMCTMPYRLYTFPYIHM